MSERNRANLVEKLLTEAENDGRRDGLIVGLEACKRIAVRYEMNRKLKTPMSIETLTAWTEEEIDRLRLEIRKAAPVTMKH